MSADLIDWVAPEFMPRIGPLCSGVIVQRYVLPVFMVNKSTVFSGMDDLVLAFSHPEEDAEAQEQHYSCDATNHGVHDAGGRGLRCRWRR